MDERIQPEQIERMREDNYLDHIDDKDLNGSERFRVGKEMMPLIICMTYLSFLVKRMLMKMNFMFIMQ